MQATHVSALSESRASDFLSSTFDPLALYYHVERELVCRVEEGSLPLL